MECIDIFCTHLTLSEKYKLQTYQKIYPSVTKQFMLPKFDMRFLQHETFSKSSSIASKDIHYVPEQDTYRLMMLQMKANSLRLLKQINE